MQQLIFFLTSQSLWENTVRLAPRCAPLVSMRNAILRKVKHKLEPFSPQSDKRVEGEECQLKSEMQQYYSFSHLSCTPTSAEFVQSDRG